MYYEDSYRVCARDTDPFHQCRPSSVLNFLQEAATGAAMKLHTSREEIIERYHCFWMLVRMWYRLDKPLYWNDLVTVRTWHRGDGGVSLYRDFDLYCDGRPVGEAVSTWVIADVDTHRPQRLKRLEELKQTAGGDLCKGIKLHRVRMPTCLVESERRLLHYSDADVNGHVNNVRYADFTCDAIGLEQEGMGKFVSTFQVSYLKECRPGEIITLSRAREGNTWYVCGADVAGVERFEAAAELRSLL